MDRNQKIILWIAIAIVVCMSIYPPWTNGEYGIIFKKMTGLIGPIGKIRCVDYEVDLTRLLMQWVLVGILAGGLIFTIKKTK